MCFHGGYGNIVGDAELALFCLVLTSNINGSDVMQGHIVHLFEFGNMSIGAAKMIAMFWHQCLLIQVDSPNLGWLPE